MPLPLPVPCLPVLLLVSSPFPFPAPFSLCPLGIGGSPVWFPPSPCSQSLSLFPGSQLPALFSLSLCTPGTVDAPVASTLTPCSQLSLCPLGTVDAPVASTPTPLQRVEDARAGKVKEGDVVDFALPHPSLP